MSLLVSDIEVVDQHIEVGHELRTPIMLSLLSWALAEDGDNVAVGGERYGWWGDTYADVPGDHFGSRLWTILGLPMPQALAAAPVLSEDALRWMVTDGLVLSVKVTATQIGNRTIELSVSGTPMDPESDTFCESIELVLS